MTNEEKLREVLENVLNLYEEEIKCHCDYRESIEELSAAKGWLNGTASYRTIDDLRIEVLDV